MNTPSLSRPLVLVIDGFRARRAAIKTHLEREGYQVVLYDDLTLFYRHLFAAPVLPDLLFVGERLPGVASLSIIQTLRKRARSQSIPIVKIGSGEIVPRLLARLAGATAYLSAPFTMAHLLAITIRYAPRANPHDLWPQ